MKENYTGVLPNGYSFTDTLKATHNEASVSQMASNETSSHVVSHINENGDVSRRQKVVPVVEIDAEAANTVQQNGEVAVATFGSALLFNERRESQQQGVMPRAENDAGLAAAVRQNGETTLKMKEQGTLTIRREQETQIRSLHIDDDGDEDDVTAAQNGEVTPERQTPGARVFAMNRPHAWHQELAKKRHEAATVDDQPIDRQVISSICSSRLNW